MTRSANSSFFLSDPSGLGQLPNGVATPIYRPLADKNATSHGTNGHGLDNDAPIDGKDTGYGDSLDTLTETPYDGEGIPRQALVPPVPLLVSVVPQPMKTVRKQTIITDLFAADLIGVSGAVGTVDMKSIRTIAPDNKRVYTKLILSIVNTNITQWTFAVATDRSFSNFIVLDQYTMYSGGIELDGTTTFFVAPFIQQNPLTAVNNYKLSMVYYLESIPLDGDAR